VIDVIIPVYRGFFETRRCLESVLGASCTARREVIVVDDASPEPRLSAYLRELAAKGSITLVANARNRGFVHSVNAGMQLHPDRDVLLLNSDTEVADGWLDRIAACASRDSRTGTVTPFSNNATICSFPDFAERNELPDGVTTGQLDTIFAEVNRAESVELPTAVGFCMFIARACLANVGLFDEEAFGQGYGEEVDFCMRASRAGFRHLLCCDAFVYHTGEVSFGQSGTERRQLAQARVDERYPEFQPAVRDFVQRDPPGRFRERVRARLDACAVAAEGAPMAGMIFLADGDIAALEQTVRTIAENSVLAGLHFSFMAAASLGAGARAQLQGLARLLDGRHAWSIEVAGPRPDFASALREVAARHAQCDIVVIAPGADLPFAWDARLRKAAYAAPDIGAVVPMCNVSPLFALLGGDARGAAAPDARLVDRAAYCMGDRSYYEIPGIHPVCAYLRRDALELALPALPPDAGQPQAVLAALEKRLRACGRNSVICDYLYVGYSGGKSPEPAESVELEEKAYAQHHPLAGLRRAVDDVIRRGLAPVAVPGLDRRPVQLHIMHFWGGGLDKWVRDFARADSSRINMIFASYRIGETGGQRLVLYSDAVAFIPIRTWDIARPIRSTAASSIEYRRILEQLVQEFEVESIIVSSLIGHALDALMQPRKTLVVCHDFYPICQAINPWFGKTCERCTLDDLRHCARSNPLNSIFVGESSEDWHEMRGLYVKRLLEGGIEMVVASPSVAATLTRLEPRLKARRMHLIPHGIDLDAPALPAAPREASKRLRIVVLGRLSLHKGTDLLRRAAQALRPHAEITLLGCGKNGVELAAECGWNSVERYEPDALPALLASLAPHAGLLASVVPETFSYTLSELMALGIPPIATALGSFSDRIVDGESGFLFDPDPESLAALVLRLKEHPQLLEKVARNLASGAPARTTADMVRDYHRLLPAELLPIARFRVGVGRQTGLTEPYRHLSEAYAQLTDAYAQTRVAYEETKAAYDNTTAVWNQVGNEIDSLKIHRHWWRAPEAVRLLRQAREKMQAPAARRPRTEGADGDANMISPARSPKLPE
jgi:GT2 family glycosyltransferase/glycosyltransferase involved in cell wall biosynthesis